MSETPVIEIEGLRKFYKGKHRGVDGVDLEVYQGEIFGFLGPVLREAVQRMLNSLRKKTLARIPI